MRITFCLFESADHVQRTLSRLPRLIAEFGACFTRWGLRFFSLNACPFLVSLSPYWTDRIQIYIKFHLNLHHRRVFVGFGVRPRTMKLHSTGMHLACLLWMFPWMAWSPTIVGSHPSTGYSVSGLTIGPSIERLYCSRMNRFFCTLGIILPKLCSTICASVSAKAN